MTGFFYVAAKSRFVRNKTHFLQVFSLYKPCFIHTLSLFTLILSILHKVIYTRIFSLFRFSQPIHILTILSSLSSSMINLDLEAVLWNKGIIRSLNVWTLYASGRYWEVLVSGSYTVWIIKLDNTNYGL